MTSGNKVGKLRAPGVVAVVLCSLAAGYWSPPVAAQTLEKAMVSAYQNNPTLRAQRARLRATDEGLAEARSGWRPTVSASGEIGQSYVDSSASASGSYTLNPQAYGLNVQQPLFRGGRTVAATSRAKNLILGERAQLHSVEQAIMLGAGTAYMDVLRAGAVLVLNVKNEQVLRRELDATRDRRSVGDATQTDVSQAEARLAQAVAGRIQAQGDLDSNRATYRRVTGIAAQTPAQPTPLTGLPVTLQVSLDQAEENNPDLLRARYLEQAARNDISAANGELLPTISLEGSLQHSEESSSPGVEVDSASVIATLTVPLYQAGGASARARRAKQSAAQRRIEVIEARQIVREDATLSWQTLETARARVTQFKIQVNANEIALAGTRQEAQHGLRILLDVLNAEQELLDAQVNLVRAERDSYVAGLQLLAAVGRLTARDLGLPVEYYDEQAYYNKVKGKIWGTGIGPEE